MFDSLDRADPLLFPLLEARKQERVRVIERILASTTPMILRIIERYSASESPLARADGEEIAAIVSYRLFRRLDAIASSAQPAIQTFEDYVNRLTLNTIHDHLRTQFPDRVRLKNQLRHLLLHEREFALWATSVGTVAGLAQWRGRTDALDEGDLERFALDARDSGHALLRLFERMDRPIRFDAIVTLFDAARESQPSVEEPESRYERQDLLRAMWQEVLALPAQQRLALLLNLRDPDGTDVVALLIMTGVATAQELAASLHVTEAQLADLWLELPLSDNAIADRLGIDRQKVINLRKSARDRLARRLHRTRGKKRL